LWGLDDAGRPHRLNASSEPHTDDYLDWINEAVFADFDHQQIRIQKVVATKHHIIALDRHGYCYLYACPSHTAIRFVVSTYENQQNQPLDSFELPSDGWKWEQPWMIDSSEEYFDKEGWQYAFNFGANVTYRNAQSAMTFVRRRRWLRARRYTALCRWVQMAITKQSEVFLDICAGGFDIENNRSSTNNGNNTSSSSASDLYSFFALSLDGDLYWREGIQKNCPEGSGWVQIEPIPNTSEEDTYHEIAAISCSASCGLLIAITWNGLVFCRVGITSKCPYGKGWRSFASPCNLPVISVAMGRRALWMVTSSGRLWMTSVKGAALGVYPDLSKCITADSYTSMGDGMCRISVTNNDQVLGISQRDERMFIRSDVRDDELSGRSWLEIVARDGSAGDMNFKWRQVETGNCAIVAKRIPRHWIDKNFIARDCSATADLKSEWRQQVGLIISLLDNRNELLWNVFQDVETATLSHPNSPDRPSESWTKTANVHASLSTWRSLNWIDCMAHLLVSDSVEGTIRLHFRRGGSFQADFFELLGAFAFCDSRWKNALEVRTTQNRTTLNIAFASEDERDQWSDILQKVYLSASPLVGYI
uniref:Peroxin/Ferlin domain-containing protein n=1 Tax=Anisakis simplex TaxID=6269 RepID=A0A0M3IZV0_ANISI